jgi:hypothetical protein
MTFTTVDQQAPPDAGIRRDHWGRYLINHPITGQEQAWTRATTLANTLADRFGLEQWAKRNVVLGLGARHDLYAKAASCTPDDKKTLNKIVTEAEDAAASAAGANLGTALHRFTERLDAGQPVIAPPPWDADLEAYRTTMAAHEITVVPGWIERVLLVPELGVAGTCDRLLLNPGYPRQPRIGDVKTGKDVVKYGMTEIALQLAIYAHATHWYNNINGETHEIHEPIDQERAIVMHLPVGKATCTLYEVDIQAGWEAVRLAVDVRAWRQRNDLAQQLSPTRLEPPKVDTIPQESLTWLHQRIEAIKAEGHGGALAALWSQHPDIPTFPRGGPTTNQQFWAIAEMCEQVETDTGMPFGPPAPPATTRVTR